MSLVNTFKVGTITCHLLDGGAQRLDGGAMFGVVPKPLWERWIAPDDRNRIPLALRCMLIEHDSGPILVDTGVGNKENEKFRGIYAIENEGHRGVTRLEDALAEVGVTPADVRYVINTHLHFDHAGGNTMQKGGAVELSFPNATYVVQEGELQFAMSTNERTAASYFPPNFAPVSEADRWQLVHGEEEIVPGVRVLPTAGHVPYHQSIVVESEDHTVCYWGDLVPTTAHVQLPWIMGYDLEPLVTMENKRRLLARAHERGWLVAFEHDPLRGLGTVGKDDNSFEFVPLDTPADGV